MSEQKPEGKKKSTARDIGHVSQYRTIGGVKHPDVQTVEHSDVQTSSSPAIEMAKSPGVKKSKHPDWKQQTVYLSPGLVKWLKVYAVQDDREISEIVTQALEEYRDRHDA